MTAKTEQAQHTPGPWTAERYHDARMSGHMLIHGPNTEMFLADVHDGNGNHPMEANARLIAAAPEMLAALRETLASLDTVAARNGDTGADQIRYMRLAREMARAAIAKAEGR